MRRSRNARSGRRQATARLTLIDRQRGRGMRLERSLPSTVRDRGVGFGLAGPRGARGKPGDANSPQVCHSAPHSQPDAHSSPCPEIGSLSGGMQPPQGVVLRPRNRSELGRGKHPHLFLAHSRSCRGVQCACNLLWGLARPPGIGWTCKACHAAATRRAPRRQKRFAHTPRAICDQRPWGFVAHVRRGPRQAHPIVDVGTAFQGGSRARHALIARGRSAIAA